MPDSSSRDVGSGPYDLPESPDCPFCDGADTELHSPFGTALSVATYWCRRCRTAFEWVKWPEERERKSPQDPRGSSRPDD